jgi:hypothetical protein
VTTPYSAIANLKSKIDLSLPLFMLRIDANHSHHALAVNDFALVTHLFYGSTDFHLSNSAPVQIVWGQLDQHSITRKNPNKMLAHLSRNMRQHLMLGILQLNSKHSVRQSLKDLGHNFYSFFLRHIRSERILLVPTNSKY